jgi:hypothetical protein
MVKMFAGIAMMLTPMAHSHAEGESTRSVFFRHKMSESTVVLGYKFGGAKTHPFCTVNVGWRDGSYLLMSVDLIDEEFWIRVINNSWSNPNPDYLDKMKVQINFSLDGKFVDGNQFEFGFVAKNVIYIPSIVRLPFLDALARSNAVTIVMPGNYSNVVWLIGNIMPTLATLGECIGAYGNDARIPNLNIKPKAPASNKEKL